MTNQQEHTAERRDYVMLPRELMGHYPEIFVPVVDDAMRDAGYVAGDRLRVLLGATVHDGDNVLATIDGRCTVMTYCHDEEGLLWLVPQNSERDAVRLTAERDVRILGRVAAVEKCALRTGFRDCLNSIRRTKNKQHTPHLTDAQTDAAISAVGSHVHHAREWYAVFRALKDSQPTAPLTISLFCRRVSRLLPAHSHLPVAKELQRMAVLSFAKPVAQWSPLNAPVHGSRFDAYLHIAQLTMQQLRKLN